VTWLGVSADAREEHGKQDGASLIAGVGTAGCGWSAHSQIDGRICESRTACQSNPLLDSLDSKSNGDFEYLVEEKANHGLLARSVIVWRSAVEFFACAFHGSIALPNLIDVGRKDALGSG